MEALELWSGKSSSRAAAILYYCTSKLRKASVKAKIKFDECSIFGNKAVEERNLCRGMMGRVKECITGMKRRINKRKLSILAAVVAMFVLPKASGMLRASCKLLGLNQEVKYTDLGLKNRTFLTTIQH